MCPWFNTHLCLFSLTHSFSGLCKCWAETPHHSRQLSTYLHYVRRDERREMKQFYYLVENFSLPAQSVFHWWNLGRCTTKDRLFTMMNCSFQWKSEHVCLGVCVKGWGGNAPTMFRYKKDGLWWRVGVCRSRPASKHVIIVDLKDTKQWIEYETHYFYELVISFYCTFCHLPSVWPNNDNSVVM